MAKYIQPGKTIDYVCTADTNAEDIVVLGKRIGVAACSGKKDEVISVATEGVFECPKSTDAEIAIGDTLYYDATNKVVTKTSTDGIVAGYAISAATAAATTVNVKLGA